MRRSSMALSYSPSASVKAFLASIMPAPVASRRRLTSAAVKSAMSLPLGGAYGVWRLSAVLGALGAGRVVAGGRHALDGGDLPRGDRDRLGRSLGQRGGGAVLRTGQQLALPVGQRLVAADDRLAGVLAAGVGLLGRAGHE